MVDQSDALDKRKHPRVRVMKRIKAIISENELDALLHDISGGGAALGTTYKSFPDEKIEVTIEGIGVVVGKVVRPIDAGLAVKFVDVDAEIEQTILSYAKALGEEKS